MTNQQKGFIFTSSFGAVLVLLFFLISKEAAPGERFAHALFFSGLIEMLAFLACLVRNGGIFKTLSYFQYRRKRKRLKDEIDHGILPPDTHVANFQEFVMDKYERKWNGIPFFVCGAALLALYALLAVI